MSKMIAIRLPDDLAAWLKRQGNQTDLIVTLLEEERSGVRGIRQLPAAKNNSLVREPTPESHREEPVKRRVCSRHRTMGCTRTRECVAEVTGVAPEDQEWA